MREREGGGAEWMGEWGEGERIGRGFWMGEWDLGENRG